MKIQTDAEVKNFDGEDMKDAGGKVRNSGQLMADALLSMVPNQKLTGVQKYERGKLAEKLYLAVGEVDVTVDEAKRLKDAVGEVFFPLTVMRLWDLIETKENGKDEK